MTPIRDGPPESSNIVGSQQQPKQQPFQEQMESMQRKQMPNPPARMIPVRVGPPEPPTPVGSLSRQEQQQQRSQQQSSLQQQKQPEPPFQIKNEPMQRQQQRRQEVPIEPASYYPAEEPASKREPAGSEIEPEGSLFGNPMKTIQGGPRFRKNVEAGQGPPPARQARSNTKPIADMPTGRGYARGNADIPATPRWKASQVVFGDPRFGRLSEGFETLKGPSKPKKPQSGDARFGTNIRDSFSGPPSPLQNSEQQSRMQEQNFGTLRDDGRGPPSPLNSQAFGRMQGPPSTLQNPEQQSRMQEQNFGRIRDGEGGAPSENQWYGKKLGKISNEPGQKPKRSPSRQFNVGDDRTRGDRFLEENQQPYGSPARPMQRQQMSAAMEDDVIDSSLFSEQDINPFRKQKGGDV